MTPVRTKRLKRFAKTFVISSIIIFGGLIALPMIPLFLGSALTTQQALSMALDTITSATSLFWLAACVIIHAVLLFAAEINEERKRRKQGLCPACTYDRVGLPDPNTACPECGQTPSP